MFLVEWERRTRELEGRAAQLAERGYRSVVLPVWGAKAQLFTRGRPLPFTHDERLRREPSAADIVQWARGRLADRGDG